MLVIAGLAAAAWLPVAPIVSTAPDAPQAAKIPETSFGAWPARAPLGAPPNELFGRPPAPPSPPAAPAATPQAPANPAAPPPMPYRVAGTVVRGGVSSLLLAKGETVLPVAEGDTLEGSQRTASTRKAPGEADTRIQLTTGDPHTSMRRSPGSGSSSL